jgi:signal transduction histidine kinase
MELRGADAPELPAAIGQVDRLQGTIDTLLAVARDTVGSGAQVDLAPILDALAQRRIGLLARDGRPLRIVGVSAASRVRAAPTVVAEILDVLLDNAHRHGAGTVTVTVVRSTAGWRSTSPTKDRGSVKIPGSGSRAVQARTATASASRSPARLPTRRVAG